jgi:hypothetical protein
LDKKHVFPLRAISKAAVAVLLLAAASCLSPALILWFAPGIPVTLLLVVSVIALSLAALFLWFATSQQRSCIVVTTDSVALEIPVYGRSIALDRVIPQSPIRLTAKDPKGYRLRWRTNGLSVPGYQLGWFRTEGEGRVLAAITGDDLVAFKTIDGFSIIVSPQDSEGLIATLLNGLNKAAPPS